MKIKARLITACGCEQLREVDAIRDTVPPEIRIVFSIFRRRPNFAHRPEEIVELGNLSRLFRFEGMEYILTNPSDYEKRAVYIEAI